MMDKRVALIAATGGIVAGVAGANVFMRAQAVPLSYPCPAHVARADADIDAEVKRLHAHNRDQYVPHPARSPLGDSPKTPIAKPSKAPIQ